MSLTQRVAIRFARGASLAALVLTAAACGSAADSAADGSRTVTVYTGRHYGIEPVFEAFTEATGIAVRLTTGSDPELRERLMAEGANTPADLLITADATNIELASAAGLLAPFASERVGKAIPAELRSEDNTWHALSRRLRVTMHSTDPATPVAISWPEQVGAGGRLE